MVFSSLSLSETPMNRMTCDPSQENRKFGHAQVRKENEKTLRCHSFVRHEPCSKQTLPEASSTDEGVSELTRALSPKFGLTIATGCIEDAVALWGTL